MSENVKRQLANEFVAYLTGFEKAPEILAQWRHSLIEGEEKRFAPYLREFAAGATLDAWTADVLRIVAGLYGHFPVQEEGARVTDLAHKIFTVKELNAEVEAFDVAHVRQLVETDRAHVLGYLVPFVLFAVKKGAKGLDYGLLTEELLHWGKSIQMLWSQALWGSLDTKESD